MTAAPLPDGFVVVECPDCRGYGVRMSPFTLDDVDNCPSCNGKGIIACRKEPENGQA